MTNISHEDDEDESRRRTRECKEFLAGQLVEHFSWGDGRLHVEVVLALAELMTELSYNALGREVTLDLIRQMSKQVSAP